MDARTLQTVLVDVAPRTLLLAGGSLAEREELARLCRNGLAGLRTRVVAVKDGGGGGGMDAAAASAGDAPPSAVAASAPEGSSVEVALPRTVTMLVSDELAGHVKMRHVMRYALAQVEAEVGGPDPHHVSSGMIFALPLPVHAHTRCPLSPPLARHEFNSF